MFSDDFYGYIQVVNYFVCQFVLDVVFGWQMNVWVIGMVDWVLCDIVDLVVEGQVIVEFIYELGVYSGEYVLDFIVFDKFECDCFSFDVFVYYGWNVICWFNYLVMVKQVMKVLLMFVMLW